MSELSWPHLNTSIWKVQSIASRAQRPLTTALWNNNFPSLRGAPWRNNGSSTRNGSRFDLDDRHLSEEYGHPWGEIKNVMFWLWLKPICRGLLSQCTRACANSTSNPSGYAVGIWLPVSHAPSCIVTTNPSRAGLNPTSKTRRCMKASLGLIVITLGNGLPSFWRKSRPWTDTDLIHHGPREQTFNEI